MYWHNDVPSKILSGRRGNVTQECVPNAVQPRTLAAVFGQNFLNRPFKQCNSKEVTALQAVCGFK